MNQNNGEILTTITKGAILMFRVLAYNREEFEMQPLWLAPKGVKEIRNCHFRLRRSFEKEFLANSKLQICAESYYALYVNGIFVGRGPARGTYSCNFVDEYDIGEYLIEGINHIAAEVFCNNFPTFLASPAEPAIFIEVGGYIADESWEVQVAEDWRRDGLPLYTKQIGSIEWRDWREEPDGWKCGLDDSIWQRPLVLTSNTYVYRKALFRRDVVMMQTRHILPVKLVSTWITPKNINPDRTDIAVVMSTEPLESYPYEINIDLLKEGKPVTITPTADGDGIALIVDFGQAYIGGIEIDIEATSGQILDIGYDEAIENGRLITARQNYNFVDRHILRKGRQNIVNYLHWRGGRYMQLVFRNINDVPIKIHALTMLDQRYPSSFANFESSDPYLNELWKRSIATMSACALDTFVDCPWREIAFWVNDFLVQQEFWLQLSGASDLVKRSFTLALSQPVEDDLIPGVCPYDGKDHHVLFATTLFLPIILSNYERYLGDNKFVDSVLPAVTEIINRCKSYTNAAGLLQCPQTYWNFIDWSYELNGDYSQQDMTSNAMCVVNWFYVLATSQLAHLYRSRDMAKSIRYINISKQNAENIIKYFWNPQINRFNEFFGRDNTPAGKLPHALAVLSGFLDPTMTQACLDALEDDACLTPELYMMHFLFKAWAQHDRQDCIVNAINMYWLPMLSMDCATIWEANVHQHGKNAFNNTGSLCHAFSLAPISFLQQEILGIEPLEKGYASFSINPKSCGLEWVKGTIPTPKGIIEMAWEKKGNNLRININIPREIKGITLDGRTLTGGSHVLDMRDITPIHIEKFPHSFLPVNSKKY